MSNIRDLVTNPSKFNNTTLNTVNHTNWATLLQSLIVIEDDMLIFREPVRSGSLYTRLQLVHLNAIGRHLNAYCTLHCICLC